MTVVLNGHGKAQVGVAGVQIGVVNVRRDVPSFQADLGGPSPKSILLAASTMRTSSICA